MEISASAAVERRDSQRQQQITASRTLGRGSPDRCSRRSRTVAAAMAREEGFMLDTMAWVVICGSSVARKADGRRVVDVQAHKYKAYRQQPLKREHAPPPCLCLFHRTEENDSWKH